MSVFEQIITTKIQEVSALKKSVTPEQLKERAKSTCASLSLSAKLSSCDFPAIIAEIKRASPSKGIIRSEIDVVGTAKAYLDGGAAALSVLTDEKFFQGSISYLSAIRAAFPNAVILRKDFIIDEAQVWESKIHGADCTLLIVAALSEDKLKQLYYATQEAEIEALIEVHTNHELGLLLRALPNERFILGINNRDLKTFITDLRITEEILTKHRKMLEGRDIVIVSESGIEQADELAMLSLFGVKAFLIGESLMRKGDPGANLALLRARAQEEINNETTSED